jgi:aspartate aminotransferase/aminotransferase
MLAKRMRRIDSSGIRKVFDLALKMDDPVNFSIGQPHFDVPEEAKTAAKAAIDAGKNRYTVTQGTAELRTAVHQKILSKKGMREGKVLITSGVSGGIVLAILALTDEGDEVLVPDPYFVMYKHLPNLLGARAVPVDTYPDFRLRPEALEKSLSSRTKVLVMNSPANPTGVTYTAEEIALAVDFAAAHDLVIISDEIYEEYFYEDGPLPSPAPRYDKTLLLGGFSKTYSMTGWRVGFAAGPEEIIDAMTMIQQFTFVCAPSFAQEAVLSVLDLDMSGRTEDYRRRRDLVCEGLSERFEFVKPTGAFYIFPRVPWGTGHTFAEEAVRNNLLIIPGGVFSERDTHFRIAFTAPDDHLRRGIQILNTMAHKRK